MKKLYFRLALLSMTYFCTSCTKNEVPIDNAVQKIEFDSIDSLGVYLSYPTKDAFNYALKQQEQHFLNGANKDNSVSRPAGFVSMYELHRRFDKRMNRMLESNDSTGWADLKRQFAPALHYNSDTDVIRLNCHNPLIATLINGNGIVKIGNEIHQFSYDREITLRSGNKATLAKARLMTTNVDGNAYAVKFMDSNGIPRQSAMTIPLEYSLMCGNPGSNEARSNVSSVKSYKSGNYTVYAQLGIISVRRNNVMYGYTSITYWAERKTFLNSVTEKVINPTVDGMSTVIFPAPSVPMANYRKNFSYNNFRYTDTVYDNYYTTWNGTIFLGISEKLAKHPSPGEIIVPGGSLPALIMRYGADPLCADYLFNDITPSGLDMQTMGNNYYWMSLVIEEAPIPVRPFMFKAYITGVGTEFAFKWI
ncbi:hypothetical protein [Chitinophaga sp. sic0106]|uniref:hypothetical protein n=1 Tax=Chitinophaga sp. sic0106 TaxID=2854785 RepID=UPI001C486128|nr:hypothetical protein [Chitinophaga sp. sic0106]MBV7529332.1 hypothetical protein [Chitinophaga sp. sic0106]